MSRDFVLDMPFYSSDTVVTSVTKHKTSSLTKHIMKTIRFRTYYSIFKRARFKMDIIIMLLVSRVNTVQKTHAILLKHLFGLYYKEHGDVKFKDLKASKKL